jgi:hypothetical protein
VITIKQAQRFWDSRQYDRLFTTLLAHRVERSDTLAAALRGSLPAAAMMLIRLDELDQAHVPLAQTLIRCLLACQATDGGWDDPMTTALCVRALQTSRGQGQAIDRGISYLADLQKPDGSWPREPIRRLAADAYTTAFVLFQLGTSRQFQQSIRVDDALVWLGANVHRSGDADAQRLWQQIVIRQDARRAPVRTLELSWS